jgi:hypothetical protein
MITDLNAFNLCKLKNWFQCIIFFNKRQRACHLAVVVEFVKTSWAMVIKRGVQR